MDMHMTNIMDLCLQREYKVRVRVRVRGRNHSWSLHVESGVPIWRGTKGEKKQESMEGGRTKKKGKEREKNKELTKKKGKKKERKRRKRWVRCVNVLG